MPYFQGIAGRDRLRMREKKKYQSYQFLSDQEQIIQKKKSKKKFKKLKNTIRASLQAKIGWEKPRKRENKNYHSDQLLPDS